MDNENVSNNIMVNNDTSLDKCDRDMGNREEDATELDDDENDNISLESQMSTTSNRRSSLDSVERRQSKDNPYHDQQQEQQQGNTSVDDAGSEYRNQSTNNNEGGASLESSYNEQGMSQDQKDDAQVAFILVTCRDMKQQYHLDKLKDILRTLRSSVGNQVFRELTEHYLALKRNRCDAIQDVNSYFATIFNQEEITRFQDDAAVEAGEYVSSLEDEEESDSSGPPSFDADDESMLSSGSKGESDQDELFPSSSSKKRGRGDEDDDNDDEESEPPPRPRKQRSISSKAASDDESQDESQMHEKDLDDDETDQSQSKANKQQEMEAKDKEKAEQQEKEEDAKYDAMPEAYKQVKNNQRDLLAVVTNINDKTSDLIGALFDPTNPNRIGKLRLVFRYYMATILPSIKADRVLATRMKAKADGLASIVGMGGDASLSKLLLCCEPDTVEVQDEDPEVTAEWERLTTAIDSCGSKLTVVQFLTLGNETKHILMHLLHSQALQFIFSELTLSGITAHLSDKASAALTSAMKELAQLIDPEATFSLSMVVLSFMKQFALPGLVMNGARGKAVDVIIDIFSSLTYVGRSDDQKKAYKKNILSLFERLDASTISGGRVEGSVSKYFSGDGRQPGDRRKHVVRLGLALYLKTAIEDLLGMRDSGQYTRGILRLSATDISRKLSKDIKKALFLPGDFQIKAVESMKKYVLKKKPTARTLLIESDEQVDCLMHLINNVRTFSDDEQPT